MFTSWKDSIREQRATVFELLEEPVKEAARDCEEAWPERGSLTDVLLSHFDAIPYCTYLYVVDMQFKQISDNVGSTGRITEHYGRDRSPRPYMKEVRPDRDYVLSDAYISLSAHRPSLTAIRTLYQDGKAVGYLGTDLDLRNVPAKGELYVEPNQWQQIKGDPAIRGTVFQQTRVDSLLDKNIDQFVSILDELIVSRGVFQSVLHFSSSRATVWTMEDPYRYRILQSDAFLDPDVCLAYPRRNYPKDAEIPCENISDILRGLKTLRFADDTIYLRSASLNIFNGLVSLTFSCDGSHYMPYAEFLDKDSAFWFGE
ncbi:MAG: PDC sensor domain-containing protein [Ectothiorhodospiraceae bacterium]|nr:PDC sensor domain-containing protein [Ectothiorhodospiraceae bacterium]